MSIFERLKRKRYVEMKFQPDLHDKIGSFEQGFDVRYGPTTTSKKFMSLVTFSQAFDFLDEQYKTIKKIEETWNTDYTDVNLPNMKHEYHVLSRIYSRSLFNRLSLKEAAAKKARNSKYKMDRINDSTHNGHTKEDSLCMLEYGIKTMRLLIELNHILKNENFHHYIFKFTIEETEYFSRH